MLVRLTDFKRGYIFVKKESITTINKFLYVNITILIFEFLKKEFCYFFLKHMFRGIPQIFWNSIPDFRSDLRKGIFILVCSGIIDIVITSG